MEKFYSVFKDESKYNGMTFEIVREMTEEEYDKEAVGNMFIIKLENGEELQAFEEEINGMYESWLKIYKHIVS